MDGLKATAHGGASVSYPTNVYIPRCYSQQANTEKLPTVDYEYVNKVTTNKHVLIIDVREPDEIKEHGKIPNSLNIPLGSLATTLSASEKEFKETFKRDKPKHSSEIIFYCMIGKRSGVAQQNALNLGYKNAKNYLGSWTDWATKSQ
ncbi:Uncharacterized protein OBRU01_21836 [Operophtera brumata]|uniref:Rhodanese domain-containing protein n=1 Tax=Operophtera brumata TaxID=104452 RepID=A0A0L7KST6_OPEBR|nr:Uncharacterized protein OBRU01_21836 [Operophtera brumata]